MKAVDDNGSEHYRNVIQAYFDAHRADYPGIGSISDMSWRQWEDIVAKDMASKGLTFNEETYPVASNTPQTLNILKKQFMLLQNPGERELYAPHSLGDGTTTWPSQGEDATNTWTSWGSRQDRPLPRLAPLWQVVDAGRRSVRSVSRRSRWGRLRQ